MATREERKYLRAVARAELIARERQRVKERVRFLRRHAVGFTADEGYDLRSVDKIRGAKLGKLTRYFESTYPHSQKSGIAIRPRTRAAREALQRHTRQVPLKGVKTYWIETAEPENTKVKIRTVKATRKVRGKLKKVEQAELVIERAGVRQEYYFFPEARKTFEGVKKQAEHLISTLPDGFYFPFTGEHELIPMGAERDKLMDLLRYYERTYEKEFVATIIGFRFVSSDYEGAKGYQQRMMDARESRRLEMRRAADKRRATIRKQRRALIRGIKKP